MGNNTNNQSPQLIYKNTCHEGLIDTRYQQSQQLLVLPLKVQEGIELWRKDIDPLLGSKHLFLPHKLLSEDNAHQTGCCMQQGYAPQPLIYHVCYLPFFYTLEKEILTRRHKNTFFRQQQLWKLVGYLCKAVLEWQQCYPTEQLGIICPSNLVINFQGQIRVVSKLTFFGHNYASLNVYYTPPESRNNSLIKYALNPYSDPVAVEASLVYGIGAVLLEATTLTLADWEPAGLQEKLVMLRQLGYSPDLKETILTLLQQNQMARYKTNQLLQLSKKYRNRYM